jgi:hypothetical protein
LIKPNLVIVPLQVDTFSDTDNDSELRIGAYLAIMNCPTESTVETVKAVLTSEPVNQGRNDLQLSSLCF